MKKKKHEREKLFDNSDEVFFTLGSLYTRSLILWLFRLLWQWHFAGYTKTKRTRHPSLVLMCNTNTQARQFLKMRPSPI